MGSGHYPNEGEGKAATFYGIQVVDRNGNMYDFKDNPKVFQDKSECYRVSEFKDKSFFYGGPAGCINQKYILCIEQGPPMGSGQNLEIKYTYIYYALKYDFIYI